MKPDPPPRHRLGRDPLKALDGSTFKPLWLDNPERPDARDPLAGDVDVDLLVVGGGFTGLWTALRARERDAAGSILVIEGDRIAEHATGRNGGFCDASLTHGQGNGMARWPDEYAQLEDLGRRNLDAIAETIAKYDIECGFRRGGTLAVATQPHQIPVLRPELAGFLDRDAVRRVVDSPTYLAGRHLADGGAIVDPARLAWGLAAAAENAGVRIAEHTRLTSLRRDGQRVRVKTTSGTILADRVVLATNVFRNPLRRLRWSVVPVFDYVLATEPLTDAQLASLNWDPAMGVSDLGNQFHYYRVTPDQRILWGGYDAIYHYGRSIAQDHYDRRETFQTLARNFAETFPQLRGIRFTHRWSGVIDTSTRFCAMFGTSHRNRVAYALGFTGLGVGASRFAADVMLDLLDGAQTERTRLRMVRERSLPFPPEPFAWLGIQLTRWAMAREDQTGKRNLWLRTLDRLGLGFDS